MFRGSMAVAAQRERDASSLREKDMAFRAEAGDAARRACQLAEARVEELEKKLEHACRERDVLQQRLEEAHSSLGRLVAGRKETVAELKVMIATLHKEMSMMQAQLTKHKDATQQLITLRADNESLKSVLTRKGHEGGEGGGGARRWHSCNGTHSLNASIPPPHPRSTPHPSPTSPPLPHRDMKEVKAAEVRALAQVAQLRAELDEHGLALRVKAANEAEAACQQRLVAAEAEISQLRQQLDETEKVKAVNEAEAACLQRLVAAEAEISQLRQQLDVTENRNASGLASLKLLQLVTQQWLVAAGGGDQSAEAASKRARESGCGCGCGCAVAQGFPLSRPSFPFFSPTSLSMPLAAVPQTIGAAYEEMQSQNRRLLQQISERDEYNTQLIAEGVKARQLQASLQAEKQSMETRMQHATAAADVHKQRVVRLEEQSRQVQASLQAEKQSMETRMQHATAAADVHKQRVVRLEEQVWKGVPMCRGMWRGAQARQQLQVNKLGMVTLMQHTTTSADVHAQQMATGAGVGRYGEVWGAGMGRYGEQMPGAWRGCGEVRRMEAQRQMQQTARVSFSTLFPFHPLLLHLPYIPYLSPSFSPFSCPPFLFTRAGEIGVRAIGEGGGGHILFHPSPTPFLSLCSHTREQVKAAWEQLGKCGGGQAEAGGSRRSLEAGGGREQVEDGRGMAGSVEAGKRKQAEMERETAPTLTLFHLPFHLPFPPNQPPSFPSPSPSPLSISSPLSHTPPTPTLPPIHPQVKAAWEQLGKAVEDARGMAGSVEAGKRKQAEMERETTAAREAMEGLQKDLSSRNTQMVEVEEKLETERNKRRRVEEERDALSARLARLGQSMERGGGSGGPSVEQLQEELRQYKSIMKCSVCHDRQKEVSVS
ncbi:unnamed protein product [Closterium sp. NIES-54]